MLWLITRVELASLTTFALQGTEHIHKEKLYMQYAIYGIHEYEYDRQINIGAGLPL